MANGSKNNFNQMEKHVMIDIEALGLRPGAGIFEIGAVEFFPEPGWVGASFEVMIEPKAPLTADVETLRWHAEQGTWPRDVIGKDLRAGLEELNAWVRDLGEVDAFWSWGATYDFPLLTAAYEVSGIVPPWKYYNCRCARTVWQTAFGNRKHGGRPHRAQADALASAVDLNEALAQLGGNK